MNHLYSVEQAPAMVPAYHPLAERRSVADPSPSGRDAFEGLRFRQLQTPAEISRVLHLRGEIRLPESTLSDAGFAAREKKETR